MGSAAGLAFGFVNCLISVVLLAYTLACAWFIAKKAGYEPWMGLLMIVPILNLVLLYFFAFTDWPVEKEWKKGGGQ